MYVVNDYPKIERNNIVVFSPYFGIKTYPFRGMSAHGVFELFRRDLMITYISTKEEAWVER
jgi:hypothetical protein